MRGTIGIVDCGIGDLAGVPPACPCWAAAAAAARPDVLGPPNVMLLPGVRASAAMEALHRLTSSTSCSSAQAAGGQPIVGICLGMQLLAHGSARRATPPAWD